MKERSASMRDLRAIPFSIAILAITSLVYSQENRPSKPFQEWSKKEAEQVLEDSPWAAKQEVRLRYASQVRRVAGGSVPADARGGLADTTSTTAEMGGAEAPVDFQFTLRLRSALIVRQAVTRLKQLEPNTDTSEKGRAAFDARLKGLLECPACQQNYVLTLSAKSKERPGADPIYTTFKGGRLADLQRYIFIANSRGERRDLVHFVPPKAPGDEAVFYFPRFSDKGEALLTPTDTVLIANFTNNDVNMNINFRIDVSRLIVNGQVDF